MMNTALRRSVLLGVAGVVATGAVVLGASPAAAHVTVSPTVTAAGSFAVLTFSVPHGCDGAGTTRVSIQIPEQILSVTPTVNPSWTVEKVMAEVSPPVTDSHGNEVTERVSEVVYTAVSPLPEGYRDAFELSLQLPDAAGEMLVFPTVQTCEVGETAWVQVAGEGEEEPEHPAPMFELTEASGDGHGDMAGSESEDAEDTETVATSGESTAASGGDSESALTWIALVVGAVGTILGLLALLRPNLLARRTST